MDKQPMDSDLSLTLKYILENPELLNAPEKGYDADEKEKKLEEDMTDLSNAYLGPQIWDNMLLCDDLKMEPVELNEICQGSQNTDTDVSDLAMLIESANYSPCNTQQAFPEVFAKEVQASHSQKDDKEKHLEDEMPDLQSAFLGPQLWNNMLMSDDLKLEPVEMNDLLDDSICASNDLAMLMRSAQYSPSSSQSDETLMLSVTPTSEVSQSFTQPTNGQIPFKNSFTSPLSYTAPAEYTNEYSSLPHSQSAPHLLNSSPPSVTAMPSPPHSVINNVQDTNQVGVELLSSTTSPIRIPSPKECDFQPSEADLLIATPKPEDGDLTNTEIYDPKTRKFMDDELKPQPIIRKAKKLYVNDENKDNKYWARREKNNVAAKRSREARRVKENQIALRASFLEKENQTMKQEITSLREELAKLVEVVKKYEDGFH